MRIFGIVKIFIVITLMLIGSTTVLAQTNDYVDRYSDIAYMDINSLEIEYENVKLLRDLRSSKTTIDSMTACGEHVQKAKSTRQSLLDLNAQFKNNPTEAYRRDANELKRNNTQAITDYRACFSASLANYANLTEKGVVSYEIHRTRSGIVSETYSDVTDPSDYLMALELEMESRMLQETSAGRVTSVSGTVQILTGGTGANWRSVSRGTRVAVGDIIRTTSSSRVGLVFESPARDAGKVELYLAGETETKITHYTVSTTIRGALDAGIDLIRGTVRAITRHLIGKGPNPMFSVRGGSAVLGMRGTEVAVSYSPTSDIAKFTLNHGDAYLQADRQQTRMQPLTTITVKNGVTSAAQTVTKFDWDRLAAETRIATPSPLPTSPNSVPNPMPNESLVKPNLSQGDPYKNATLAAERFLLAMAYAKTGDELLATTTGTLKRELGKALEQESLQTLNARTGDKITMFSVQCVTCDREAQSCQVLAEVEKLGRKAGESENLIVTTFGETFTAPQKVGAAFWPDTKKYTTYMAQYPQCK